MSHHQLDHVVVPVLALVLALGVFGIAVSLLANPPVRGPQRSPTGTREVATDVPTPTDVQLRALRRAAKKRHPRPESANQQLNVPDAGLGFCAKAPRHQNSGPSLQARVARKLGGDAGSHAPALSQRVLGEGLSQPVTSLQLRVKARRPSQPPTGPELDAAARLRLRCRPPVTSVQLYAKARPRASQLPTGPELDAAAKLRLHCRRPGLGVGNPLWDTVYPEQVNSGIDCFNSDAFNADTFDWDSVPDIDFNRDFSAHHTAVAKSALRTAVADDKAATA